MDVLFVRSEALRVREFFAAQLGENLIKFTEVVTTGSTHLAYHRAFGAGARVLLLRQANEIPAVVEKLVNRVAFEIRALLLAHLALYGIV